MAKKKLDLSGMYTDTSNIQDKNNIDTSQIQDKKREIHGKYEAYRRAEENLENHAEEGGTSAKPKKINMAFTARVYDIIKEESEKLSIAAAYYINEAIRQADLNHIQAFYDQLLIKPSKDCIPRKKGQAAQRIFIKLDADVYNMIVAGAEKYNQTLTQYVNMVLESNIR
ncbi:hypothetical protein [Blautia sp. MSJ-9]|uniref:hypothetical protein n=1 Tax=Blautia sp. MSJ-9 TaxID=2841511 RepID=UPI001C110B5F|nr:hypothetical protein [Blautia sp. MSJ-9]MBU5679002.1 hypothetical protein [Blautia sp. MSJ-9]